MRSILAALLLLVSPQDGPSPLRVDGTKLLDRDGKEVRLRGVSLADPDALGAEYKREHFELLAKSWKANAVRLPIHPGAWKAKGKERFDKLLDDGIEWCRELGLYAIVDYHAIGNPKTGKAQKDKPEYDSTMDLARAFWKHVAARYKTKPWVVFEVFNEPMQISWEELRPIATELVGLIRAAAPDSLVIVSGPDYTYDLRGPGAQPIEAKNLLYAWHVYPVRGTSWDSYTAEIRKKAPVIATEWGYDLNGDSVTLGSTEAFGVPILNFMEAQGIHWTAWCWHPQWGPPMLSGWGGAVTPFGRLARGWLAGDRPKTRPSLKEANDFAPWIRKIDLKALGESKFDLCVIDLLREGKELTRNEIDDLKWSFGGPKLVLAWLAIGDADEARPYWQKEWSAKPPEWLGPGAKARFWDEKWQKIALDQLERIQAQGFDGAVLEGAASWAYWQKKEKDDRAKPKMVEWVTRLSQAAKRRNKGFLVLSQNGEELVENAAFLGAIDGIVREETYFSRSRQYRANEIRDVEVLLEKAAAAGKKVLQIEYVTEEGHVEWVYERSKSRGFVPFIGVKELDRLVIHKGHEPD